MKYKIILLGSILFYCLFGEFEQILIKEEQEKVGNEIFLRMRKKIGNVDLIKNISTRGSVSQPVPNGILTSPIEVVALFPDCLYMKIESKEYSITKDRGWIKYKKGYFESMSEDDHNKIKNNLKRNLIHIVKYFKDYEILFQRYETIEENDYGLLLLLSKEQNLILYIDMETYLPYKIQYSNFNKNKNENFEKWYIDYKVVNNIKFPVHTKTYDEQGNLISENLIKDLKCNTEISSDLF